MAVGIRPPCELRTIAAVKSVQTCPRNAYPWILAATILASSMAFIDGSAVNVALPVLQTELHASSAQAQWVIEAYALFLCALILTGGSLGDRLGRKRVFVWGIAGFGLASLACASARTANELVAARAFQGLASALLTPGSLSILGASFDTGQRGKAVATWSSFSSLTGIAGPLIGGFIVQHASWRWIFLINLPLALTAIAIALFWIPETRADHTPHGMDWLGAVFATVGLGAVVYALIAAGGGGWTPLEIEIAIAGVLMLAVFIRIEARAKSPMMPLGLFGSPAFRAANLQTLLLYAALGGGTYLLPFNLILIQHYSPTAAGFALLPYIVLIAILSPLVGRLCAKTGARIWLGAGPAVAAIAFAGLAWPGIGGTYLTTFFWPTVVLGLGMAFVVVPLTMVVLDSVGEDNFGIASGTNNAVARTAGLLAIATLSLVLASAFNRNLDAALAKMSVPPHILAQVNAQRPELAAAVVPQTTKPVLRAALETAIAESYVAGFRVAMVVAAGLALAGSLCALALPRRRIALKRAEDDVK